MALTDIVKKELGRAKNLLFTPKSREGMLSYLHRDLGHYIENAEPEERKEMYNVLERRLDVKIAKYDRFLGSWYQKAANAGGVLTALNQAYNSYVAFGKYTGLQFMPVSLGYLTAKTVPEAVYMTKYVAKSGDLLGAIKWLAMKPLELAIPIIGPLMGTNWTEKIVRQRILYETRKDFLDWMGRTPVTYKDLDRFVEQKGHSIQPYAAAL